MLLLLASMIASLGAVAEVTSSDGKHYFIGTCYGAPDLLATEFTYPDRKLRYSISGKDGWVSSGEREIDATDSHKRFAFGHQFHAIYLHFRSLVGGLQSVDRISFGDTQLSGVRGRLPHGGVGYLLENDGRVAGMRFELPDTSPILVEFDEWRPTDAGELPVRLNISHEGRTFDYRYRTIAADCPAG